MKLSNKGRYAVQAMFDLALHGAEGALQVRHISERQRIPVRFLEQVFQDLKRAELVTSKRGPRGGYQLSRPADEIRLGDVIRAIEGPVALAPGEPVEAPLPGAGFTAVQQTLEEVSAEVDACLDQVHLGDMAERARALGVDSGPGSAYVYAI